MTTDIAEEIAQELQAYTVEVQMKIEKAARKICREAISKLKETSPRGHGKEHYADGWKAKLEKSDMGFHITIYNAKKPGLTHLLENGHLNRDGTRAKAFPHIKAVQDEANEKLAQEIEKILGE